MVGMRNTILCGDVLDMLATVPDGIVQCCVTSPPYWGLRDYGEDGQIGLEPTPEQYVEKMVAVFREVKRVLRDDGVLFLNLGDTYHGGGGGNYGDSKSTRTHHEHLTNVRNRVDLPNLKPKDLVGIPWRVAFALQSDGWWLRSDIIWHKPNPMPESVRDRPTKAHEYIFLLAKSKRYYYDADAVREAGSPETAARAKRGVSAAHKNVNGAPGQTPHSMNQPRKHGEGYPMPSTRNRRSVWTVATKPFRGAHFAVFPPDLIEPCIKAGSAVGDLVLDPFMGSGTTALVAYGLGRDYLGIELNPDYVEMANERLRELPMRLML